MADRRAIARAAAGLLAGALACLAVLVLVDAIARLFGWPRELAPVVALVVATVGGLWQRRAAERRVEDT